MKLSRVGHDIKIEATVDDVRILKDCLLYIVNFVHDGDLGTAIGVTRDEVAKLKDDLLSVLRK